MRGEIKQKTCKSTMYEKQFLKEFSELFEQRREQFITFAFTYTRDRCASEDLFMDATITLWECRDHWEKGSNLPALLLTILKRKCLNYLNHEKLKSEVRQEITDLYQRELNLRISTLQECSPEKIFNQEIQHVVDATLESLPGQSRRIFTMSRFEHLSNKDIADTLGLSIKTVEFHITKVLKVMRVALKDYLFTLII